MYHDVSICNLDGKSLTFIQHVNISSLVIWLLQVFEGADPSSFKLCGGPADPNQEMNWRNLWRRSRLPKRCGVSLILADLRIDAPSPV